MALLGLATPLVAASSPQDGQKVSLEEKLLATIPEGLQFKPNCQIGHERRQDAVFRHDGRGVAYPARRGDKAFIMFGDSKGPDLAKCFSPMFSSDGRSWAYWASTDKEAYIHSNLGLLELGAGYESLGVPVVSPDGRMIAYTAGNRNKRFVIAGGKKFGEQFETVLSDPQFSPDGSKIGYSIQVTSDDGRVRETIAVGNEILLGMSAGFERIKHLVFSPTGDRVVLVAEKDLPLCREFIVMDGKDGPVCRQIDRPVFSPDGKKLAYAAAETGRWRILQGNTRSEEFHAVGGLTFSPDGAELSYWAKEGTDSPAIVIKGGWKSKGYPDIIWGPTYSPDGRKITFAVGRRHSDQWKEFVVVGDKDSELFDEVWSPRFSPDGRNVVFGARVGRELWWKVMPIPN